MATTVNIVSNSAATKKNNIGQFINATKLTFLEILAKGREKNGHTERNICLKLYFPVSLKLLDLTSENPWTV